MQRDLIVNIVITVAIPVCTQRCDLL